MIYWRPSEPEDVDLLAPEIRTIERQECLDVCGVTDMHALLRHSMRVSDPCCTIMRAEDQKPLAMFGVNPFSPGCGVVWMLGSDECFRPEVAGRFLRFSRGVFDHINEQYQVIFNFIHPKNTQSLRWLRWSGCEFPPGATQRFGGTDYLLFTRVPCARRS